MPQSVLGGAAVMMFSSIVISGIQLITKEEMTPRNLTIVSVALGVGYGMGANMTILAQAPQAVQLILAVPVLYRQHLLRFCSISCSRRIRKPKHNAKPRKEVLSGV